MEPSAALVLVLVVAGWECAGAGAVGVGDAATGAAGGAATGAAAAVGGEPGASAGAGGVATSAAAAATAGTGAASAAEAAAAAPRLCTTGIVNLCSSLSRHSVHQYLMSSVRAATMAAVMPSHLLCAQRPHTLHSICSSTPQAAKQNTMRCVPGNSSSSSSAYHVDRVI